MFNSLISGCLVFSGRSVLFMCSCWREKQPGGNTPPLRLENRTSASASPAPAGELASTFPAGEDHGACGSQGSQNCVHFLKSCVHWRVFVAFGLFLCLQVHNYSLQTLFLNLSL